MTQFEENNTDFNIAHCFFFLLGRHFSSDTSKAFMHGNIDHMDQPEEYHKMAVPGMVQFLNFPYRIILLAFTWPTYDKLGSVWVCW